MTFSELYLSVSHSYTCIVCLDTTFQIIMNVEEKVIREEKLKQLNQLVGELSFPPYPPLKSSSFQLW